LAIIVAITFSISNSSRVIAFCSGIVFIIIGLYGVKGMRQLNSRK
jgi:hypothetical protein